MSVFSNAESASCFEERAFALPVVEEPGGANPPATPKYYGR